MSAIERDREIAAKATTIREWFNADHDGTGEMTVNIYDRERWLDLEKWLNSVPTPLLIATARARDAEHIVRLHNRQPLYDALVDAVREMVDCPCADILECEFYIKTEHALDALDQEDQP